MFARMFEPVWPATGTMPVWSGVRPHCPQNGRDPPAAKTPAAAPASPRQRHATILFLGSFLMVPSAVCKDRVACKRPPRAPDARWAVDRLARDLRRVRALHDAPGLVRKADGQPLPTHDAAR